jgi:hypothetical protein
MAHCVIVGLRAMRQRRTTGDAEHSREAANAFAMTRDEVAGNENDGYADDELDELDHELSLARDRCCKLTCGCLFANPCRFAN